MHYKRLNHFITFQVVARERHMLNQYSYVHISCLMIISHFTRLNSIFWIRGAIKHSGWMAEEKRKKRVGEVAKRRKVFMKGILRYLVYVLWSHFVVPWKFNYRQHNTRLDVSVCVYESISGKRMECSSLSIHQADTRQSSVQNGSQDVGSPRTIKELGGSVPQPPRDLLSPWWVGREN